jgi:hypothetical protein
MAVIEELPDDCGSCKGCGKICSNKCTGCKQVYYCGKVCQRKDWKLHRPECKALSYKICSNSELGNYVVASTDIKAGEVIFVDNPIVVGPAMVTAPVCLACYTPVDGSYKCPKSGWPLCGPTCAKKVEHNPEVIIPAQCEATFEIEDYTAPCYLYESITVLRALLLQKSAPAKYKALMSMQSHIEERRGTPIWDNVQERIVDVMKKTFGVMVFEAICPQLDFTDETIQKIQGILDTNGKEIRLAYADVQALYPLSCLMEHSCQPNVKINYSKNFKITCAAGKNIREGEHLSIMYTHALWGTIARRDHLNINKRFWCKCKRCSDPTEFGTNFSTILDDGHPMLPEDPLNADSDWVCKETGARKNAYDVKVELSVIGKEIELLMEKGGIDDFEEFIESKKKVLHTNHYHMVTVKHQLLQMYGRTEGHLIQDMTDDQLKRKIQLCKENLSVLFKLDPDMIRLEIYAAASNYELHLPLLQIAKRKWETGKLSTEDFRVALEEPYKCVNTTIQLLQKEVNEMLPEGQLLLQAKDTLEQLEGFMKTVGCQM